MNKVKVIVADNFNITNILINNNNEGEILLSKNNSKLTYII